MLHKLGELGTVGILCRALVNCWVICLGALMVVAAAGCQGEQTEENSLQTVTVYIDSGAKQCQYSGHPLAKSEQRLNRVGVAVLESACGVLTDVMFPAVCGGRTEKINLHTINAKDLAQAENAGFKSVTHLRQGQQPGFKPVPCDKRGVNLSADI